MKAFGRGIVVAILTWEAKLLLKRTRPQIVAITGSVGKTSTKDAIYTVLKDSVRARKSAKSYNSEIGMPLTILGLETAGRNPLKWLKNIIDGFFVMLHPGDYPKVLVLEMGVDRPGDMKKLTDWIRPDVVVLTRLPDIPTHVEFFDSPEAVVDEKWELVKALKPDGDLVFNQDDEKIRSKVPEIRQTAIGYSRYSLSPYTASGDTIIYDRGVPAGIEFRMTHADEVATIRIMESLGIQQAYNAAAACAVASIFDIDLPTAANRLCAHVPPPGRMRVLKGLKDTLIIDDTYNSSPVASERSLQTLKELGGVKRKIVVFADMMELGQYSMQEHERIGGLIAGAADVLYTIGVRSRKTAEGALEHGMDELNIYQYDDMMRAANELEARLEPGDVVLVKGSQSMRAERVVEEIMGEPERFEELLVRQEPMWQNRR